MPRWLSTDALMQNTKDIDQREQLNLPNLDVDKIWDPIVIDLDKVVSYCHDYESDGTRIEDRSELTMIHGGYITINIPFKTIDRMIRFNK